MDDAVQNQGNAAPISTETRGDPGQNERPVATEARGLRLLTEVERPTRGRSARVRGGARGAVYEKMVNELKGRYKISIRKWRKHMSGVAYELKYRDGRIKRLITAPRPRSPVSASIFLHEVGHHAVGFHRYSPRCLEEYYVWQWALREMTARGIAVDGAVLRHYRRSMHHYVRMAMQRGEHVPAELQQFVHVAC
ncbi:MAG: hypothetical protein ACTHN5_20600 [Phycisphaerae bacterium]